MHKEIMEGILNSNEFMHYDSISEEEIEYKLGLYEQELEESNSTLESKIIINMLDKKESKIRKKTNKKQPILNADDKKYLIKYSEILFGSIKDRKTLENYMTTLVWKYHQYRYESSSYFILNDVTTRKHRKKNETYDEKLTKFKKSIKSLMPFMGGYHLDDERTNGKFIHTMKGSKLMKSLEYAYNNPEEFVPDLKSIGSHKPCNKADIEKLLRVLLKDPNEDSKLLTPSTVITKFKINIPTRKKF